MPAHIGNTFLSRGCPTTKDNFPHVHVVPGPLDRSSGELRETVSLKNELWSNSESAKVYVKVMHALPELATAELWIKN